MNSMVNVMDNIVSISVFNKGEAGKIFQAVRTTNQPKLVLRRNEPECVIISPDAYRAMIEEIEDLRDYKRAVERLAANSGASIPWSEVLKKANLSEEELDEAEDVEFE